MPALHNFIRFIDILVNVNPSCLIWLYMFGNDTLTFLFAFIPAFWMIDFSTLLFPLNLGQYFSCKTDLDWKRDFILLVKFY